MTRRLVQALLRQQHYTEIGDEYIECSDWNAVFVECALIIIARRATTAFAFIEREGESERRRQLTEPNMAVSVSAGTPVRTVL